MIGTDPKQTRSPVRGATFGALLGLAAHAVAFGVAYVVGATVEPGGEEWFASRELWAFVTTWLVGEAVIAVICLVAGTVLIARRNRAMGLGLILSWLVLAMPVAALALGI